MYKKTRHCGLTKQQSPWLGNETNAEMPKTVRPLEAGCRIFQPPLVPMLKCENFWNLGDVTYALSIRYTVIGLNKQLTYCAQVFTDHWNCPSIIMQLTDLSAPILISQNVTKWLYYDGILDKMIQCEMTGTHYSIMSYCLKLVCIYALRAHNNARRDFYC